MPHLFQRPRRGRRYDLTPDKYLFRSDAIATDPMYEVPFFVRGFRAEYVEANKEFVASVAKATTTGRFQNKELYQELMALTRITHPLYNPKLDLFLLPIRGEGKAREAPSGCCTSDTAQ